MRKSRNFEEMVSRGVAVLDRISDIAEAITAGSPILDGNRSGITADQIETALLKCAESPRCRRDNLPLPYTD